MAKHSGIVVMGLLYECHVVQHATAKFFQNKLRRGDAFLTDSAQLTLLTEEKTETNKLHALII